MNFWVLPDSGDIRSQTLNLNCFDGYITLSPSIDTSRSGLYASGLPGVEEELIAGLSKYTSDSTDDTWDALYARACQNLVSDVQTQLNGKFNVDLKLLSRVTSTYLDGFNTPGAIGAIAGVKISFRLPKYARLHVISVSMKSEIDYPNPGFDMNFYDTDADGEVLLTKNKALTAGLNTITVDTDFEVDALFIGYDPNLFSLKSTENKRFDSLLAYDPIICEWDCWSGQGQVEQINGGGLSINYVVYCSVQKFVCEQLNLFRTSLLWRVGVELTAERRFGERLNRFSTMTIERATELMDYYMTSYERELYNVIKGMNIEDDPWCFTCKNTVYVKTSLP